MSQDKFTPGPWKLAGQYPASIVTQDDSIAIAVIEEDGGYEAPGEQIEANGRLIAAAPELLAVAELIATIDIRDTRPTRIERLESAARNETSLLTREVIALARAAVAKAKGMK